MAGVRTPQEKWLNRTAVVAVFVALIVMLTPIYWIASTAFKPRNLATTIPPTVVFEPTVAPFVKLFTKRSQLRDTREPAHHCRASWHVIAKLIAHIVGQRNWRWARHIHTNRNTVIGRIAYIIRSIKHSGAITE